MSEIRNSLSQSIKIGTTNLEWCFSTWKCSQYISGQEALNIQNLVISPFHVFRRKWNGKLKIPLNHGIEIQGSKLTYSLKD